MGRSTIIGLLLLGFMLPVSAAPSAKAKAEIAQLMDALSESGCRFQRNGSWHDTTEARAHLQRKYDYLLKKDKVDSAEQFIERAASRSSMSGQPYRVQCAGKEQDAASWFNGQLKRLRSSGVGAK
jgi:uncharacterized protein DUF5329